MHAQRAPRSRRLQSASPSPAMRSPPGSLDSRAAPLKRLRHAQTCAQAPLPRCRAPCGRARHRTCATRGAAAGGARPRRRSARAAYVQPEFGGATVPQATAPPIKVRHVAVTPAKTRSAPRARSLGVDRGRDGRGGRLIGALRRERAQSGARSGRSARRAGGARCRWSLPRRAAPWGRRVRSASRSFDPAAGYERGARKATSASAWSPSALTIGDSGGGAHRLEYVLP